MAGDKLKVFFGEFLVLPVPLELGGNWCSHGCNYCFANADKPHRQIDVNAVTSLLNNYHKRNGLDAKLLRLQYPVNVSNHVDPFSESNHPVLLPIMRLLTELDIPIYFQTRGGNERAITETLDFIKPSVFYVSMTHQNDETRKWHEPNAPSMDFRFSLISELVTRGHRVLVGLNPLVPEWIPEPEEMTARLKSLGVEGVWVECLHLNRYQRDGMKEWQRKRLGPELIKRSMKLHPHEATWNHFLRARQAVIDSGMDVYTAGQPNESYFFDPYHETYPKTFPVVQDFVNFCYQEQIKVITWDIWSAFFYSGLPRVGETAQHMDYLRQAVHRELSSVPYLTNRSANRFNYLRVLQYSYWDDKLRKLPFSPLTHSCFQPLKEDGRLLYQDEDGNLTTDKHKGMPIFLFTPILGES